MKLFILKAGCLMACFSLFFLCKAEQPINTRSIHASSTDSTVTFLVSDMGCQTDSKMVETALYRKKGVKSVAIAGEKITIVYNSAKITAAELKKTIENTGTCEDPNAKVHKVKVQ